MVVDNDNEREDGEEDGRWAYQHHYHGGGGRSQMGFLAMSLFAFCILAPLAQYYSLVCCNGDRVASSRRLYINPASRFNLSLGPPLLLYFHEETDPFFVHNSTKNNNNNSTLIRTRKIEPRTTANLTNMSLLEF
jgi:hypothetical protein